MSDKTPGKRYSREFKEHAVALGDGGEKPVSQVEAELGIGHGQISRWGKEVQARYRPPYGVPEQHMVSVTRGSNFYGALSTSFYGGPAADWDMDGGGVVVYRSVPAAQTMDDIPRMSLMAAVFADEQREPFADCEPRWLPYARAALYVVMLGPEQYSENQLKCEPDYHDHVVAALSRSQPPCWYLGCSDEEGYEIESGGEAPPE